MAGRGINDMGGMPHSSDMAMNSKTHVKHYHSSEGAGGMKEYPDTSELIQRDQKKADSHVKGRSMKPGYRY